MGSQSSKGQSPTKDEDFEHLLNIFNSSYEDIATINYEQLNLVWGGWMKDELVNQYSEYIDWKGKESTSKKGLSPSQKAFFFLYSSLSRKHPGEMAVTLSNIFETSSRPPHNDYSFKLDKLIQYISDLLESFLKLCETEENEAFAGWMDVGVSFDTIHTEDVARFIVKDLNVDDSERVDSGDFESWLFCSPFFVSLQSFIINKAYKYDQKVQRQRKLLPVPEFEKSGGSLLNIYHIILVNSFIPPELCLKWRMLYSSKHSGESWIIFLSAITNQGPTYIFIKDNQGAFFGGFASTSWTNSPSFFGDSSSFIFTLLPTVDKFEASNFNKNFQYLNTGQSTLPNGLGMGGQFDYWGLFIDSTMTHGAVSPSCSTYAKYKTPTESTPFQIEALEVWALGEKPLPVEEEVRSSALDSQLEATAMLEMMGRPQVSKGFREPEPLFED